jgi:fructokinase
MPLFGSIEAGGTKFVCGVGTGPEDLITTAIPNTLPAATIDGAVAFFREHAEINGSTELTAIGIGSFGPVDLDPLSPTFGYITSTPKLAWQNCDLAGAIGRVLGVPVGFDTDVNAAALGEARWGAAQDLTDFLYLTVGTGIGGGAMAGSQVVHGLTHTEMGHIRIPHDFSADPFPGCCPFHSDCLEGLASGPALEARWGMRPEELPDDHPAWAMEARYLGLGLTNWVCTLSPRRIILGGGVMQRPQLFPLLRSELCRLLNGYIRAAALLEDLENYVVPPALGNRSGVLGGIALAEMAWRRG